MKALNMNEINEQVNSDFTRNVCTGIVLQSPTSDSPHCSGANYQLDV